MDEQAIDEHEDTLFEGEGEISKGDLRKLKVELAVDHHLPSSRSREAFGKIVASSQRKQFSIGKPVPISLDRFMEVSGQSILADIQPQMKDYEFCPLLLGCSFVSENEYRFRDAYFEITLQTLAASPGTDAPTVQEQAVAYKLFPVRSEDEIHITTNTGGPITANPGGAAINIPLPNIIKVYSPHVSYIEALHERTTQPAWKFTRTQSHEISGSHDLLILVQKPKGTRVQAAFSLTAHIEFLFQGKPLKTVLSLVMFFRRRGSSATITDPTVQLC